MSLKSFQFVQGGGGGNGSGTVTSVDATSSNGFSFTGGPITTTGTLVLNVPTPGTSGNVLLSNGSAWISNASPYTGTVTSVATGTGLTGGTITTSGTLSLANTSVVAGSYTYPNITVDAQGRLTSASNGTAPVTSVTGTAPVVSSGGTTPAISMPAANGTTNGYLTSTDWTTFNNKGSGTVTSVVGGTGLTGGTITTTGTLAINTAASLTWTNTQFFNGSTSNLSSYSVSTGELLVANSTTLTGVVNYDVANASVIYYTTNSSGNFGLNFRGSGTTTFNNLVPNNSAVTAVFLNTNGVTPYYLANVSVDSVAQTIKWLNTTVTAGNASAIDTYSITLIKTAANTYTVLASQSKFV